MSIIYDAIYVPIITYGCGTWGWATYKVHIKRKLISSQRRALLLITKAFRTTSNLSLQVIARKPPTDLIITERQKLNQLKWGATIQTRFQLITHNEVEWTSPFQNKLHYNIPIKCNPDVARKTPVEIYTDGSKINDLIGCSFVAYENLNEVFHQCIHLGNQCSVFQAELYAIKKAINWANRSYTNINIHIYTDSLSAYYTIHSNNLHPLAEDIRNAIYASTCTYTITWIRSHQNVLGNETADSLAKQAAEDSTLPTEYNNLSQLTLKQLLKKDTIYAWQDIWNNNSHHITYEYIPDLHHFLKLDWFSPNYYTTQMLTGHGKFACYLAKFTNKTSDECLTCSVEDGPKHYLYDCIIFEQERLEIKLLIEESEINWPCRLSDIWNSKIIYDAFQKLTKRVNYIMQRTMHN
ncbi:uncharacterized protein [Centruroides vittatus]|uniref:uncharacterized protein n=1 Tax=Centruroides vittatus TaxID=120091 RepID=UPI0035100D62